MTSTLRRYASFTAHEKPTVGDSKISYIGSDHLGWLLCDGRSLTVADYYLLWSVIGYSFGGSGATFNLPAAAGRVPGVSGTGAGLTPRVTGDMVGTETHALTIAEMPAHTHGSVDVSGGTNGDGVTSTSFTGITVDSAGLHDHGGVTGDTGSAPESETTAAGIYTGPVVAGSGTHNHSISPDGTHVHTITDPGHNHNIGSTGGGQVHNNMQPTIFMGNMFIYSGIPTLGVWPYTSGTKVK